MSQEHKDSDEFSWSNASEQIQKVTELQVIYNLHHDIWDDSLLEPPFLFYYQRVLFPRERQVLDYRIQGLTEEEISRKMNLSLKTIVRYEYNIRYIYRNKSRDRVFKSWWNKDRPKPKKVTAPSIQEG